MAADIPTSEPITIVAGDTLKWTRALDDWSYAAGWRLTYELRGASSLTVVATADTDGIGHSITAAAIDTGKLAPGQYRWYARVGNGSEVYTVGSGILTVEPNPSSAHAGDLVENEENELALINAQIKELLASPMESYSTAQRSANYRKLMDLYVLRGIVVTRRGRQRGQRVPSIAVRLRG